MHFSPAIHSSFFTHTHPFSLPPPLTSHLTHRGRGKSRLIYFIASACYYAGFFRVSFGGGPVRDLMKENMVESIATYKGQRRGKAKSCYEQDLPLVCRRQFSPPTESGFYAFATASPSQETEEVCEQN